jgi:hypothetical protein
LTSTTRTTAAQERALQVIDQHGEAVVSMRTDGGLRTVQASVANALRDRGLVTLQGRGVYTIARRVAS